MYIRRHSESVTDTVTVSQPSLNYVRLVLRLTRPEETHHQKGTGDTFFGVLIDYAPAANFLEPVRLCALARNRFLMYEKNLTTYYFSIDAVEIAMFVVGHTPKHKGQRTTTDPLKTSAAVAKVKSLLQGKVRDYALWAVACNSMLRAGDLVKLTWENCEDDGDRITLRLLQGKTKKPIAVPLPSDVSAALRAWRAQCESEHIYSGQRGPLTVASWGRMVKAWCREVGFDGNFSSHTCRKTGVRVRYDEHGTSLATLMHMLSHTSEATTLIYMGKMTDEVERAYAATV